MRSRRIVAAVGVLTIAGAASVVGVVTGSAQPLISVKSDTCAAYQPNLPAASEFVSKIDNPYFPLPVGRTLLYRGSKGAKSETDRVTVTSHTRVIEGITATTVRDVSRHHSRVLERTNDWYAQDAQGNVWYLGEATASFEGGHVDRSGSWLSGVNGAKPGIIMRADPTVPDSYRQECLQGEAEDMAWTVSLGGSETLPYGRVHRVMTSLEYARIEPTVVDEKVYAPGLGIVSERTMAGDHEVWALARVSG